MSGLHRCRYPGADPVLVRVFTLERCELSCGFIGLRSHSICTPCGRWERSHVSFFMLRPLEERRFRPAVYEITDDERGLERVRLP